MKVLALYQDDDGRSIGDAVVSGGAESVVRSLAALPEVSVIELPKRERWKVQTQRLVDVVRSVDPDLVVFLRPSGLSARVRRETGVPCAFIFTYSANTGASSPQIFETVRAHVDAGGTLWMVSRFQMRAWEKFAARRGEPMPVVSGVLPSSFIDRPRAFEPRTPSVDLVSVGRCDPMKDIFRAHKVAAKTGLTSLVFSNTKNNDYQRENSHWSGAQETRWDRPHPEVLDGIAGAAAALIACPIETWSIFAMEALSLGVPVILCASNDEHGAEEVAANPGHYIKIKRRDTKAIAAAVTEFKLRGASYRQRIAELTFEKHRRERFENSMREFFETAAKARRLAAVPRPAQAGLFA